ncbi:Uma2 family endonuclease [Dyadobacter sp. CY312]|uniref:Uma2 family endonuclease n=1 Tax=Dyadobacter sp. CY312 TaxID=2907303 RepID=UPI001F2C17CD|nr:Uma2 family endonuclease [Dyadobacter sp. CY312]MCE7042919.1 Uma2 family endonuclease [Dyadobacter sp. CY312]
MLTQEPKKRSQTSNNKYDNIPDSLIYEVMDGEPLYYRGYKDVLNNKKSLDDIMGSSGLQSFIIQYILEILYVKVGRKIYHFLTNEVGTHLGKKDNLSGDVYVYEKSKLTPAEINEKYINIPAKIAVEIDSKIDISKDRDLDYVNIKTQKLLNFGVEKVIWIFTGSQKVMVSEQGKDWLTKDWNQDIELLDGHFFNICQYLKEEGVKVETNF